MAVQAQMANKNRQRKRWLLSWVAGGLLSMGAWAQSPAVPALQNLQAQPASLAQYKGRVVLVNYWATWCGPCLHEMPDLNELYQRIDKQRAVVIGIAADEAGEVKSFAAKLAIKYPLMVGDPDQIFAWTARLGNTNEALPFSVLLDQEGKIQWIKSGGRVDAKEVAGLIDKLIAKQKI
jgi:peroxiredoxin